MGFYATSPLTKGHPPSKTRVGVFRRSSPLRARSSSSQPLAKEQFSAQPPSIFASGRPYWPSRDPIGEMGGRNILGFVSNNPLYWVDLLGLEGIFERNPVLGSNEANCPKCITIVVGGASDKKYGTATRTIPNHGSYYWGQRTALQADLERLRKACKCTNIALIGHSYGGDSAFDVAVRTDVLIQDLVTLDPVSTFDMGHWLGQDKPENVEHWTNIYQRKTILDAPGSLFPGLSLPMVVISVPLDVAKDLLLGTGRGDGAATAGHQWGYEGGASRNLEVEFGHAYTEKMLLQPFPLPDDQHGPPDPSVWERLRASGCLGGARPTTKR